MKPDLITAICSIIIATIALAIALWQTVVLRRHNRISVRPHLRFYRYVSEELKTVKIELRNHGLGPAFVRDFRVFLDANEIPITGRNPWRAFLASIGIVEGQYTGSAPLASFVIPESSGHTIIEVTSADSKLHQKLLRVDVKVSYESAYGEKFRTTLLGPEDD